MAAEGSPVRAGAYAEGRYRRGLRLWRVRARVIIWAFVGPFIAAGMVGVLLLGHPAVWAAGVVFGLGTGVLITLRESPPWYIEKWRIGAEGERKTEKALKSLERASWLVLHEVQCTQGNYDHVVAGRAGVFLLETKNPQGIVYMRSGEPHLRRRSDPEADTGCREMRPAALARAASLKEEIQARTGRRVWVQAVVVLWSAFDEGLYEDARCVFVHGNRLREWLESRPKTLAENVLEDLASALRDLAPETRDA